MHGLRLSVNRPSAGRSPFVLIAEDDDITRRVLSTAVRGYGYGVDAGVGRT